MRWLVLALAWVGCGVAARQVRSGTLVARPRPAATSPIPSCDDLHARADGARACAIAELDVERGRVQVFLRIEPDALPADREDVVVRYGAEREALGAVEGPVELRYEITLESRMEPGGSYRHAVGWHLRGRSFLPQIEVDGEVIDVPATLLLEVGATPLYTSAGPGHRVFDAPSFDRLSDEAYEVGPVASSRREIESDTLWFGATGRSDGELEAAADAVATAYRQLHDAFGEPPTDALLVTLHPPVGEPWSERAGASIVWAVASSEDPAALIADDLIPLVQLWLAADDEFVHQGLADYFAVQIAVDLLGLEPTALSRAMLRRSVVQDATARGSLAGYCLDGHLRQRSSSLAATLRRAHVTTVRSTEALLSDLGAIQPEAAGYLAALLDSSAELAIDECLERAGLRAEPRSFEAPKADAWRAAIGVEVWAPLRRLPVLRVEAVDDSSVLAAGDLLLEVGGHPISVAEDVAYALRDASAGDSTELLVRRRGEALRLGWVTPRLEAPAVPQERVELISMDAVTP